MMSSGVFAFLWFYDGYAGKHQGNIEAAKYVNIMYNDRKPLCRENVWNMQFSIINEHVNEL